MSTAPKKASGSQREPVTIPGIAEMKRAGEKVVMVTAYDYPSAQIAEEAGVDVVLVGDTAAMVVLGLRRHHPGRDGRDADDGGGGAPRAGEARC